MRRMIEHVSMWTPNEQARAALAALIVPFLLASCAASLEAAEGKPHTIFTEYRVTALTAAAFIGLLAVASALLAAALLRNRKTQRALRESELRYRTVVERIPAVTYIAELDEVATPRYVSPQVKSLFGITQDEFKADPDVWLEHVHPEDRDRVLTEVARCHASGDPLLIEYRMVIPDGTIRWFRDEAVVVRDEDGTPLFLQGVMYDMTAKKAMESELARISMLERRKVQYDLHDGVCQHLSAVKMLLAALRDRLEGRKHDEAENLTRMADSLGKALEEAKMTARGLMPLPDEPDALVNALRDLTAYATSISTAACRFSCDSPVLIEGTDVSTQLFLTAQEAVMNALKHAETEVIEISLSERDGQVTLCVADEGSGFVEESSEDGGFGIEIMEHRAGIIGASLEVTTNNGTGTRVTCVWNRPEFR
jgi:PAS domain S-box-containing protein